MLTATFNFFVEYHEREVFPSHREIIIAVNDGQKSFTGSSGILAWELEAQRVHLLVAWSLPYNLNIYNSYFGVAVIQLTTHFTRSMLPYWYQKILANRKGRNFQRGFGGGHLVYKHSQFFVIGNLGTGYHPTLNIRWIQNINPWCYFSFSCSVMPWLTKDLSPSIWHKLYLDSLKEEQNNADTQSR